MTDRVSDVPGIDVGRCPAWLADTRRRCSARSGSTSSPAGTRTSRLGHRRRRAPFVLRRPPLAHGSPAPTTWAASTASSPASPSPPCPVPAALGFCADPAVNDAPFYVMAFVDGHVVRDSTTAERELTGGPRQRQPVARRHAGRDPRRRHRRRRARRPRPSRGLHRPPAEALARPGHQQQHPRRAR